MADITRLLLEARRALAAELDADLEERGYPDLRPGHAALFLSVDRRSGSRLTDLAERTRLTKQAMRSMTWSPGATSGGFPIRATREPSSFG
jgi:hypothetical protein